MDPKVWGKAWWQVLFSSALGYSLNPSIDDQYAYSRFYMLLSDVLPCESCKTNFEQHYRNVPINFYLHSRAALLDWILILHNEVNKTLGKPPLTLEEAIFKYLGQETVQSETFRQCIQFTPAVMPVSDCGQIEEELRPDYSTRDAMNDVVEGFDQQSRQGMDYKDVVILVLLGILLYFLYRNK